nr:hypothetical protein [Tanacetum cinerariifolium]
MLKAARKTCSHIYKKKNSDVTFAHTLKSTRPLLVQQSTAYATTEVVGSVRLFITYTRVRWVHLGQMGSHEHIVDVLQKSEKLKQTRALDIDLLEKAKENKMQYEENLKSHALTMNEEMVKERNAKIAYTEDIVRQKAIMELVVQLKKASTTTEDLRKAYEKCNDIPQESDALIDTFLKQESDKDYKMHLAMYSKAIK